MPFRVWCLYSYLLDGYSYSMKGKLVRSNSVFLCMLFQVPLLSTVMQQHRQVTQEKFACTIAHTTKKCHQLSCSFSSSHFHIYRSKNKYKKDITSLLLSVLATLYIPSAATIGMASTFCQWVRGRGEIYSKGCQKRSSILSTCFKDPSFIIS